jgi:serralysin
MPAPGSSRSGIPDSNGNFLSFAVYAGTSTALEALETSFHQDLNGDGTIGIPTTVIESSGSTSLVLAGSNYFLNPVGGGTGPTLKYQGAAVVPGQFDPFVPVAAEQISGGYEVALKNAGTGQFSIWNTDSNGNFQSFAVYAGTSAALEQLETSFHQDLNGDGTIGIPTIAAPVSLGGGDNFMFREVNGTVGGSAATHLPISDHVEHHVGDGFQFPTSAHEMTVPDFGHHMADLHHHDFIIR